MCCGCCCCVRVHFVSTIFAIFVCFLELLLVVISIWCLVSCCQVLSVFTMCLWRVSESRFGLFLLLSASLLFRWVCGCWRWWSLEGRRKKTCGRRQWGWWWRRSWLGFAPSLGVPELFVSAVWCSSSSLWRCWDLYSCFGNRPWRRRWRRRQQWRFSRAPKRWRPRLITIKFLCENMKKSRLVWRRRRSCCLPPPATIGRFLHFPQSIRCRSKSGNKPSSYWMEAWKKTAPATDAPLTTPPPFAFYLKETTSAAATKIITITNIKIWRSGESWAAADGEETQSGVHCELLPSTYPSGPGSVCWWIRGWRPSSASSRRWCKDCSPQSRIRSTTATQQRAEEEDTTPVPWWATVAFS